MAPSPDAGIPARVSVGRFQRIPVVALATVTLLSACALKDLTDPPNWDLSLNIPAKGTAISVGTMLPSGVSIKSDSTAFTVSVSGASVVRTLGSVCAACVPLNGLSAARPAFNFTAGTTTNLPTEVTTAVLSSGTMSLAIVNGFGFDPLGGSASGFMVTTVTDANNRQLAKDSINGAVTSVPANGTVNRTLTLAPGTIKGPLTISSTVTSPAGAAVTINTAQTITVTGTPQNINVSTASVTVSNKTVSTSASEFDLSGIDSGVSDRMQSGSLLLTINNPFAVTGTLTVLLQGGGVSVTKALALTSGTSTPTIVFTKAEIRSLAGKKLNLTINGPVNAGAAITVAPKDKVTVDTRLLVSLTTEAN